MVHETFVAFASSDRLVADTIAEACQAASGSTQQFKPWNRNDVSGQPIDRSVFSWVEGANAIVADVSEPNHNVAYEVGLAAGFGKPIRLVRASNKDRRRIEEIGLLHNVGHDDYGGRAELVDILRRPYTNSSWPKHRKNREQPIYILQTSTVDDLLTKITSGIKKILKLKFRNCNPREIDRLTATEAFEQVTQSFGVIAVWQDSNSPEAFRQNHRAAFAVGIARGLDIPFLLFAARDARLPLDLDEIATRWNDVSNVDSILREFRESVAESQEAYVEIKPVTDRYLNRVYCGDPAAENEAPHLDDYFLETEQFRLTLSGDISILLGRKGSGKTAIFLQVRDKTRVNKNNIIVDLAPEGFQLVKLKEFILRELEHGARKEFIAAFWEYIVWLEIAYKILEKDEKRAKYDSRILEPFERLNQAYKQRVEGRGDFSERLSGLTDRIVGRFEKSQQDGYDLASSRILEIVYGSEIRSMRDEVLGYLKLKGIVFFLFDNLDRFWTSTGYRDLDALIIVGLVECLQDIRKRFSRSGIDFHWAIFLRSDVYEFVVRGMADYGKLAVASVEWNDRELLAKLFETRVLQGFGDKVPSWNSVWNAVSVQAVHGRPTLDFLLDACLMRPRYLIRLFETARRRAVTLGRDRIEVADYEVGLEELGYQVLEDFDRELTDVVPDADALLFDLAALGGETSLSALKLVIGNRVKEEDRVDAVVDVLIWSGCLGAKGAGKPVYISDCGFKRQFIRTMMKPETENKIVFHPTLAAIFANAKGVS